MGRTEPTFRNLLDRLQAEWSDYRRGLSPREQRAFDALFQKARAHASASGNVCRVDPLESVFLSILLEHEMEIATLRAALALRGGVPGGREAVEAEAEAAAGAVAEAKATPQ